MLCCVSLHVSCFSGFPCMYVFCVCWFPWVNVLHHHCCVSVALSSAVCIEQRERGPWSSVELHWIPVTAGGGGDGRDGEKRKRIEDKGGICTLKLLSQWDGWCRAAAFQPFSTQSRSEPSWACSLSFKGAYLSLSLSQSGICKIGISVHLFSFHYFSISCIICSASEFL